MEQADFRPVILSTNSAGSGTCNGARGDMCCVLHHLFHIEHFARANDSFAVTVTGYNPPGGIPGR